MADMLCSLITLPPLSPLIEQLRKEGITIRRPNPWEQSKLYAFIEKHFSKGWAEETSIAFTHQPVTCFIALRGDDIIGFADYECTRKDYFGPTGVDESCRGKGVGKALFLAALYGLNDLGYTYAIIGDAGPEDFYRKCVGAINIPLGDGRGIYTMKDDPRFKV
jgi:GNAT superfamily N-acetyltransferase